ncbi:MAG TPA: sulfotransferase [Bryobacteraceae bacterium]|jgi:hypothetical protein|nr:sulfotransferase [Bryobacteraceae bacterium]
MSRQYLNLTADAWRQLSRNWRLKPSPMLLWQRLGPGSLFAAMAQVQRTATRQQLEKANYRGAVVVLGYWRSGTTLLHELLCLDQRFAFPTTHACMNPHHFTFTEAAALARLTPGVQRPMDEMEVRAGSPQEDEFALLSLGARSPYEALLAPQILSEALKLADPRDLNEYEAKRWREVFLEFLAGVSARGGGRPMAIKSPTHGYRVATLRELLPDARFVLVTRDPRTHFESVIRMWRRMFELYAILPVPNEEEIREAVLADRPRFEAKLRAGVEGLPANRFAMLSYEELAADPAGQIERLYSRLDLGDFEPIRQSVKSETERRRQYRAQSRPPDERWKRRINETWPEIFERYGYTRI